MQTILNTLDGFFPALLRASWQAGVLVLVVLLAQRLLAGRLPPRWRHALWLIVLARLLLPVSVPSPASVFNLLHVPTTTGARNEASPSRLVSGFNANDNVRAAGPDFSAMPAFGPTRPSASDANPTSLEATETAAAGARPLISWKRLATWLWLAGVLGFSAVLAVQTIVLARRLRQATPVTEETLSGLLARCREEMGVRRRVALCETAAVQSPALCGVFRPRLLLPRGLAGRLSPAELRHVLLHELAHLKRHDLALNWLATALQVLHWFNPLVWLAGVRMRADRELACDALALETAGEAEKQAYGETILRLLEGFTHTTRLPGLVGILEDKRQLRRRILAIAGFRKPSRGSALAAVLVAGLAVVGLTDAQNPEPAKVESQSSVEAAHQDGDSEAKPKLEKESHRAAQDASHIDRGSDGRLWGTVLLDGKPVAGAFVSYFDGTRTMGGSGRTDKDGRIFVYPNPTAKKLIVWHEGLQAALDAQTLTNEFRVDLRSLRGGIEGRLWWGDKPWSGKALKLQRRWPADVGPAGSQMSRTNLEFELRATTSADGRFAFPNMPTGDWVIRSGPIQWGNIEVKPGEIARLDLGREGVAITGRAVTDPPGRQVNWSEAWVTLHNDLSKLGARVYPGGAKSDGSFIVPGVAPGDYQLFVAPEGSPAAGPSPHPMPLGTSGPVSVVVPTNSTATNRVIDLGAVTVKMRKQLKVGDLAPPFEVKTFDGQPIRLADFQGKVVLLCFWWASPYSVDRQRLKELKLLREQYRKDNPLVILGVNLNADAAEAEAVIAEEKWDWLQTRAANRAAFFRDEYELQSTPALLVIGPDGRVRARHYQVDGIRSALWAAVGGQRSLNPNGSIVRCKVNGLGMEFTNTVKVYYTPKDGLGIFSVGGDRWISPYVILHGPACRTGRFTLEDTPGLVFDYSKNWASSDSRSHYSARAGSTGTSVEVNVQEVGAVGERVTGTFSAVVTNDRHEKIALTDGFFSAIREAPISTSDSPAPRR